MWRKKLINVNSNILSVNSDNGYPLNKLVIQQQRHEASLQILRKHFCFDFLAAII